MKDLRNLLIDCRIELRKSLRDFHKTGLCERLDQAIQSATALAETAAAVAAAAAGSPVGQDHAGSGSDGHARKSSTTHQVAMAWQMIARDLKFSDPPLYEKMRQKVLERIQAKTMVDESTELRELQLSLTQMQAAMDQQQRQQDSMALELDSLVSTLALAVPELTDGGDRLAVAMARIDWLKAQKAKPAPVPVHGGSSVVASAPVVEPESHIPSADVLKAVAAGARKFSDRQREWSVGEAMVLSGFQHTPVELLELGDVHMATVIVNART